VTVDGSYVTAIGTASPAELQSVLAVFSEVLALPADVDPTSLCYAETAGWDSLAHMELVSSLEDRFDVMFETDDILGMRDIAAAIDILGRLGADLG
jgi:acyl carrier protein